jgi:hypothetical protein
MSYKYSICYPDKNDIEYKNTPVSSDEVLEIAKRYPWYEQLNLIKTMDQDKVNYSPSLDFTCIKNDKSFCLTANYNDLEQLEFSLWYNRPKRVKVLFGLLGEKEKMVVSDIWSIDFTNAIKYLEHFINENYQKIEDLYK